MDVVIPDWPAPPRVHAFVTTRNSVRQPLPSEPAWLKQVHGTRAVDAANVDGVPEADASFSRTAGAVCVVGAADCMPVLLAQDDGSVIGAAHAGWRGLCAGIIEATLDAMHADPVHTLAWLGPAIGPKVYEVGDEVREAFLERDAQAASAFVPNRPGHWLLDLYAVGRQRLVGRGITRIWGGEFCTYSDPARFHSFRRDKTRERMHAFIWITRA